MKNKTIVIFSENKDRSTFDVIRWCRLAGYAVHRINSDDRNLSISISEKQVNVSTSFESFSIDKDTICWFRRGEFPSVYLVTEDIPMKKEIGIFNFIENQQTFNALKCWIKQNCTYSSDTNSATFNKVDVLLKATEYSIKVPDWVVTGEKDAALSFAEQYETIASKPFVGFFFMDKEASYGNLTEKLTLPEVETLPKRFIPRFFQQYIEKKYELRSFYFHGKFFTYAILSQNNPKTSIDFRNYDHETPNRCVPFNLPEDYCLKLDRLMKSLKLDTGSFDILVDNNDEYYFLEVNPVGQFGDGSYKCNQNIEKYIAYYLTEMKS